MIDMAEDRHKFSSVLDKIGVDQPEWTEVTTVEAAKAFAERVGYAPVIGYLSRSSQHHTSDILFSFDHLMSSLAPP
jgi:carbamoylphosphate synthase large subunit